jgi:hypothetical protein
MCKEEKVRETLRLFQETKIVTVQSSSSRENHSAVECAASPGYVRIISKAGEICARGSPTVNLVREITG